MTAPTEPEQPEVGMRELSQKTSRVLALVKAGITVTVTDRGQPIARIVPAVGDRYEQLVAAGVIRQAKRPFDVADLPEPAENSSGRDSADWLDELRGDR